MTNPNDPIYSSNFGLSKREYFAAMAMQGILTMLTNSELTPKEVAELATLDADALIAELSK